MVLHGATIILLTACYICVGDLYYNHYLTAFIPYHINTLQTGFQLYRYEFPDLLTSILQLIGKGHMEQQWLDRHFIKIKHVEQRGVITTNRPVASVKTFMSTLNIIWLMSPRLCMSCQCDLVSISVLVVNNSLTYRREYILSRVSDRYFLLFVDLSYPHYCNCIFLISSSRGK